MFSGKQARAALAKLTVGRALRLYGDGPVRSSSPAHGAGPWRRWALAAGRDAQTWPCLRMARPITAWAQNAGGRGGRARTESVSGRTGIRPAPGRRSRPGPICRQLPDSAGRPLTAERKNDLGSNFGPDCHADLTLVLKNEALKLSDAANIAIEGLSGRDIRCHGWFGLRPNIENHTSRNSSRSQGHEATTADQRRLLATATALAGCMSHQPGNWPQLLFARIRSPRKRRSAPKSTPRSWRNSAASIAKKGEPQCLCRSYRAGSRPKRRTQGCEIHLHRLNSDDINAFALPGGYVHITRGLLGLANNEAEVAGVLGHEIGYVNARHTAERMGAQQKTQILGAIGVLLGTVRRWRYRRAIAAGAANEIGSDYLGTFSQSQEFEAIC